MVDYSHLITDEHRNYSLPTALQNYIHLSKYSKWSDELGRRETWLETAVRYVNFMAERAEKLGSAFTDTEYVQLVESILYQKSLPSMRALMTAGRAAERDNAALFNCAYLTVSHTKAFSEILYILSCFHPDTKVRVKDGVKRIEDITTDDQVLSYNEDTHKYSYIRPEKVLKNPTKSSSKIELEFEDGSKVQCTSDHLFFTKNRGWVEAADLTEEDDVENKDTYTVYKLTNTVTNKVYIGFTNLSPKTRFKQHIINAHTKNQNKTLLHKSILKHGKDVWKIDTLHEVRTRSEAMQLEVQEIAVHKAQDDNLGYNLTRSGDGFVGGLVTEETRAKMRDKFTPERRAALAEQARKNYNPNSAEYLRAYQRKGLSKEHRRKISERQRGSDNAMFGRIYSKEEKQKRRDNMLGEKNHFYGKRHSEESKQKIKDSLAKVDRTGGNNPSAKPVTIDGILYPTIKNAQDCLGISYKQVKRLTK